MAWEISMSAEGWANVHRNLHGTEDKEKLIVALTDDLFEELEDQGVELSDIELAVADRRRELSDLPTDVLADACFECIQQHNTCNNGGFDVWIDRQGYHTVPVDLTAEGAAVQL